VSKEKVRGKVSNRGKRDRSSELNAGSNIVLTVKSNTKSNTKLNARVQARGIKK
jgi:hypothetical protein